MHYQRWLKYGDPLVSSYNRAPGSPKDRFWHFAGGRGQDPQACWVWTGPKVENRRRRGRNYKHIYGVLGMTSPEGRPAKKRAHRFAYELLVGPIPAGKQLDHLCRNTLCVNPAHLEPVTNLQNTARGVAPQVNGQRQRSKDRCKAGHLLNGSNLGRSSLQRVCLACKRAREAERRARQRAPA